MPNKPSRLYYVLGAVIILFGFVQAAWATLSASTERFTEMARLSVPGNKVIPLTVDQYQLFFEIRSTIGDRIVISTAEPSNIDCSLHDVRSTANVPLSSLSLPIEYDLSGYKGRSLGSFDIAQVGMYQLSCSHIEAAGNPVAIVALGGSSNPTAILYRLLLAVLAFGLGTITCVFVYFKRRTNQAV